MEMLLLFFEVKNELLLPVFSRNKEKHIFYIISLSVSHLSIVLCS